MMFLFLQSLRNNVALTPSEIPMDEFKNIAAPLEIPMISSETLLELPLRGKAVGCRGGPARINHVV